MGTGFWGMSVEQAEQHADRIGGATGIATSHGIGAGSVPSPRPAIGPLLGGHLGEPDDPSGQSLPVVGMWGPYLA